MGKDVIIALDFPDSSDTFAFLNKLHGSSRKPFVKIGMELFYSEGPDIVRRIKDTGHRIFLDLKLHDIPNTVKSAVRSLSKLQPDMLNVHASGSIDMMKAARDALTAETILIAVTLLTSLSEQKLKDELLIHSSLNDTVIHYAENAKNAGLNGVVCSPLEAGKIHERLGGDFLTVTPGIRFSDDTLGDQVRVTTPKRANELGSDYIVVGRPITRAENPLEVYERCINEFCGR
jgi:orotidine-5'-phosphate decarboxylase